MKLGDFVVRKPEKFYKTSTFHLDWAEKGTITEIVGIFSDITYLMVKWEYLGYTNIYKHDDLLLLEDPNDLMKEML